MKFRKNNNLVLALVGILLVSPDLQAQDNNARQLLQEAAQAMGGLQRLQALDNVVMTGFGQRYSSNGNLSPDSNSPPKWQSMVDARRSFDLRNQRALNQERNSFQYPLAASFGHSWNLGPSLQQGAAILDHPLPAVLAGLRSDTVLGPVGSEDGLAVVQFTLANGEVLWLAFDTQTRLPSWSRRITGDHTLGDVVNTTWFTGYVPFEDIRLPLGLMTRIDWREQATLMFQVDSYHINVPELPVFPQPSTAAPRSLPAVVNTLLAPGVWDVRIPGGPNSRGGDGGAVVEFADHLVMFEAYGNEAHTLARIDAANQLVPGKQVTKVIITHHHSDHAGGLRAAVSRGLVIIAERENDAFYEEWVSRSAVNFPDALARNPQPLLFQPVDEMLVLEDSTQRLEVYQVVGHSHMANAVFAYLPRERFFMEGDLSDVNWEWHWWSYALQASINQYNLDPVLNIPVHGEVLSMDATLARAQEQAEAAMAACTRYAEMNMGFFGCPVRYSTTGPILP
jgi:hypothetical protein